MFCSVCHEELLEAENHVQSVKHVQGKKQVASSKNRIADALKVYEQVAHSLQWLDTSRGSFNLTIIYSVDDCLFILRIFKLIEHNLSIIGNFFRAVQHCMIGKIGA